MPWCRHGSLGAMRRPWAYTGHPYCGSGHRCSHPSPGAHKKSTDLIIRGAPPGLLCPLGHISPWKRLADETLTVSMYDGAAPWMTPWGSPSGWGADLQQSGLAWLGALRESCHSPDGVHMPPAAISLPPSSNSASWADSKARSSGVPVKKAEARLRPPALPSCLQG